MKTIALCGVDSGIARMLETLPDTILLSFPDATDCRGTVALARQLRDGLRVDWAVVGGCGAAGLADCDQLAAQPGAPPIAWLCDRAEFAPEAKRLGVHLCHTDGGDLPRIIGGRNPMEQTFTLCVTGTDHGEWQGRIAKTNGESVDFQSLLELVKIIKSNLEEEI